MINFLSLMMGMILGLVFFTMIDISQIVINQREIIQKQEVILSHLQDPIYQHCRVREQIKETP